MSAYTYWLPVLPPRELGLFYGSDRNSEAVINAEFTLREIFRDEILNSRRPLGALRRATMTVEAHYFKGRSKYHRPDTAPLLMVCLRDALLAFVETGVIRSARRNVLDEMTVRFRRAATRADEGLMVLIEEIERPEVGEEA